MTDKKITDSQLLGERGVILIGQIVLAMGYVFRPTGTLDAGIDGEIEIRDTRSGRVTNQIIKVQSKAVTNFAGETEGVFHFYADERDMRYWLGGNVPVILILSRPDTSEAYWVSVQAHKRNAKITATKIYFDKARNRLNASSAPQLAQLARHSLGGVYSPPILKQERLLSNLLPVTRLPTTLHIASTEYRTREDVRNALRAHGERFGTDWIVKNKQLLSLQNLREFSYSKIVDIGTAEEFPAREWSESDEPERQRDFVALLNTALRNKLSPMGVAFEGRATISCYYVRGNRELRPVAFGYSGGKKQTNRDVFHAYGGTAKAPSYCRHTAFRGHFLRLGHSWYLEVTPTYYFTSDGIEHLERYDGLLKGIKRLEKNNAVRGQFIMWAELLAHDRDMLNPGYAHLAFGRPLAFDSDVGLDDAAWLERESVQAKLDEAQASLFGEASL